MPLDALPLGDVPRYAVDHLAVRARGPGQQVPAAVRRAIAVLEVGAFGRALREHGCALEGAIAIVRVNELDVRDAEELALRPAECLCPGRVDAHEPALEVRDGEEPVGKREPARALERKARAL